MIGLIIFLVGFIAQYVDGALGMGYGASSSSFLIAIGLAPALVSASVHSAEIFASFASGVSHFKLRNVRREIVLPLLVPGVIGGILGAIFLVQVDPNLVKIPVGLILVALGARILFRFVKEKHTEFSGEAFSKKKLLILGFIGGTFDAFGGGGWGPICTSTLVSRRKQEPRTIIGSVNVAEFFTTVAIVITFGLTLGFANFLWFIAIPLIIGGIIAAPIAAYTCHRIPPKYLGIFVGIFLIILNTRTILRTLGLPIP